MDAEEKQMLGELFKAAERLGGNSDECMKWVLRFAQTDLSKLSDGQWTDLCTEVDVFNSRGPLLKADPGFRHVGAAHGWGESLTKESPPQGKWVTFTFRPSREQVAVLQGGTKEILEAFAKGEEIKFELGPLHVYLEPQQPFCTGGLSFRTHTPVDVFGFHLARLFSHYHGRVRSCRECTIMFLADRRNQHYCTTRCLSRSTQRRFREKHMKKSALSRKHPGTKGGRHGKKRRN